MAPGINSNQLQTTHGTASSYVINISAVSRVWKESRARRNKRKTNAYLCYLGLRAHYKVLLTRQRSPWRQTDGFL